MADAAAVIERLGLAPVAIVGQSLGGVTALLVGARRPELVRALVLVDASPVGADDEYEAAVTAVEDSLRRWPVPFATQDAARDFFAARYGNPMAADAWTSGLEERRDGWWPRFDIDVMTQTVRDAARQSYWTDWDRVSCPILVVRGTHGIVDPEVAEAMIDRQPRAQLVELAGAGHDLHLDQPGEWCRALSNFFDAVDGPASNGRGSRDG
jgi:pimeloyl-ACP methyl ester carboxylesterase